MAGIKVLLPDLPLRTSQVASSNLFYLFHILPSPTYKRITYCNPIALVCLAFAGSIGMTFVILACALPKFGVWWPFFVVLFYALAPIPTLIARRYTEHQGTSNACLETAIFITMGFVVSSFALPIVLAHAGVIFWGACYLTIAGNLVTYLTLIGFFISFDQEDDYSMW